MKDFECYEKVQSVNVNGKHAEQWRKNFDDGEYSKVVVYGKITRKTVREAFEEQEREVKTFGVEQYRKFHI